MLPGPLGEVRSGRLRIVPARSASWAPTPSARRGSRWRWASRTGCGSSPISSTPTRASRTARDGRLPALADPGDAPGASPSPRRSRPAMRRRTGRRPMPRTWRPRSWTSTRCRPSSWGAGGTLHPVLLSVLSTAALRSAIDRAADLSRARRARDPARAGSAGLASSGLEQSPYGPFAEGIRVRGVLLGGSDDTMKRYNDRMKTRRVMASATVVVALGIAGTGLAAGGAERGSRPRGGCPDREPEESQARQHSS